MAAISGDGVLTELLAAVVTFLCLIGAAFLGVFSNAVLRPQHLQNDTNATVRLVANIFVVMTSLVLGLMMNSAKNTLETDIRNVHALGTDLILLDRNMRALGPETDEARRHLVEYLQAALKDGNILEKDPRAEAFLDAAGASLRAIRVSEEQRVALWNDARLLYRQVVQQRWLD